MKHLGGHLLVAGLISSVASLGLGMETTKVLPENVRNITIKNIRTSIDNKSNNNGNLESIAQPLSKDLKFSNIVKGESGVKAAALEAFLLTENFSLDDSVGHFSADMNGQVAVTAPVFSYGVSDKLTVALAVPFYQAKMGVSLGFKANEQANAFINKLSSEEYNQTASAREASEKLRDAVGELNKKLSDNGYTQLKEWKGEGVGDITLASKYLFYNQGNTKLAITNALVAPTGKTSDPDILNDIPFGGGAWNIYTQLGADQYLTSDIFINGYGKLTYQAVARKDVRLATEDEAIEVSTRNIRYKLGNRAELGASIQYEPSFGLIAGAGMSYAQKDGDRYDIAEDLEAQRKLEKNTNEKARYFEAKLGYSGVPAFKRGEIPVPFSLTAEYKRHESSKNSVVKDIISVDAAVFF